MNLEWTTDLNANLKTQNPRKKGQDCGAKGLTSTSNTDICECLWFSPSYSTFDLAPCKSSKGWLKYLCPCHHQEGPDEATGLWIQPGLSLATATTERSSR